MQTDMFSWSGECKRWKQHCDEFTILSLESTADSFCLPHPYHSIS